MRRIGPMLCLAVLLWSPLSHAQSLGEAYWVHGTNPDGSQYRGTVALFYSPRLDAYSVTWQIAGEVWDGSGAFTPSASTFEVSYDGGVAIYRLNPDGTLDGVWGADARSLTGREIWFPR